jgi:hypothetical protein
MGTSKLPLLYNNTYRMLKSIQMPDHLLFFISDHNSDVAHPSLQEGIDTIVDERTIPHRDQCLRTVLRQGPEPPTLTT